MDKYKVLEKKILYLKECVDNASPSNDRTKQYLVRYAQILNETLLSIRDKTISDSNGSMLGMGKGLSDWDELCSNHELVKAAYDVDEYYRYECVSFNDK